MLLTKTKEIALGLLIGAWAALAPIHVLMYIVVAFVVADLLAGIARSIYLKTNVTSRRMRHTIGKLLAYQLVIALAYGMDTLAGGDGLLCARAVAVMCALAETKSLDEKLKETLGFSLWDTLVDKLKPSQKM